MGKRGIKDVLIVDDDASIRNLICTVLTRAGLSCDTAADGVVAMEQLMATRYAIMLLDQMMPRLDGAGVLNELRGLPIADIDRPIVLMVTASTDRDALTNVSDMVQVLVKKPFDIHLLRDLVHDCVTARGRERRGSDFVVRDRPTPG